MVPSTHMVLTVVCNSRFRDLIQFSYLLGIQIWFTYVPQAKHTHKISKYFYEINILLGGKNKSRFLTFVSISGAKMGDMVVNQKNELNRHQTLKMCLCCRTHNGLPKLHRTLETGSKGEKNGERKNYAQHV